MNVLVTGAAGKLGSAVCAELLSAGHDVRAIDRAAGRDCGTTLEVLDLCDAGAVERVLAGAEAVVHLGNHTHYTHGPTATVYAENVMMNWNVARGAIAVGARRVIFASSVQVVSGETELPGAKFAAPPPYVPGDGALPPLPRNSYALSKLAGEEMLRYLSATHAIDTVAIRFPYLRHDLSPLPDEHARPTEFLSWLPYADGATLVRAILARELPGFRLYFPAARAAINGLPVAENLARHFRGVPRRLPDVAIAALVDCGAITAETDWSPSC